MKRSTNQDTESDDDNSDRKQQNGQELQDNDPIQFKSIKKTNQESEDKYPHLLMDRLQ